MKLVWMANTDYTHTLYKQLPEHKTPQKMAWIARVFASNTPPHMWKAQIISSPDRCVFTSLDEAKDWAQAVVLLNQ
jgi:hypothetical protein